MAFWPRNRTNNLYITIVHFHTLDEASNLITPPNGSHSDKELLTLLAKTELILAAQDELQQLSEESKDIQSLQHCAEIGGLKSTFRNILDAKREEVEIDES